MNDSNALARPNARSPKAVGDVSEAMVLARLVELGYGVAIPFGDNQRYDFVVDDGENLARVQVKTGRLRNGSIVFNACSVDRDSQARRGYEGEADYFLVYCSDTRAIYRVPVADCGVASRISLRVEPRETGRSGRPTLFWADDLVFDEPPRLLKLDSFKTCATNHPDTPSRIAESTGAKGSRRRYCKECNLFWGRRARASQPAT